jgi:DUF4097 and DUF4098 domain-containing protein YvlB
MTVNIVAQDGQTSVEGLGAPVTVNQTSGSVTARHNKGSLTLSNQNGNIDAQDCSGPVEATGRYGMISLKNVFERISVQNVQGRTIIESAKGEVVVRNSGGDVRILALDGVGGNYDILAEQGDISILTGPETDAALSAKSTGGAIDSALPLTGSVTRGAQELQGRLKDGRFTIRLETQSGDIVIN